MSTSSWVGSSSIARQAAAADLWLELTGRKQANIVEEGHEIFEKIAFSGPLHPVAVEGALVGLGGLAGSGIGAGKAYLADRGRTDLSTKERLRHVAQGGLAGGSAGALAGGLAAAGVHLKHAEGEVPEQPRAFNLRRGLAVGAGLGAAAAGLATHRTNAAAAQAANIARRVSGSTAQAAHIPMGHALLGGATIGGGLGLSHSLASGMGRLQGRNDEIINQYRREAGQQDYLRDWKRINPNHPGPKEKQAASPAVRSAAGAAALALPVGALAFLHERAKHTPGESGVSKYQAKTEADLLRHEHNAERLGKDPHAGLYHRWLEHKARKAEEATESPTQAALAGTLPYTLPAAVIGGTLGRRVRL